METYVMGLLFNGRRDRVALIRKNRPEYMKGMLNGIGGKIEKDETALVAMRREFKEETGVYIHNWGLFVTLTSDRYIIYCFRAVALSDDEFYSVKTVEDEDVRTYEFANLQHWTDVMDNIKFLIPLAISQHVDFPIHIFNSHNSSENLQSIWN